MALSRGPKIITDGLVLCLDAVDSKSYSGSGDTWYDRSGNGANATFDTTPSYNSSNFYFSFTGGDHYAPAPTVVGDLKGDITMETWCEQYSRNGPHQTIICTDSTWRRGMKLMSAYHTSGGNLWIAAAPEEGVDYPEGDVSLYTAGSTLENTGIIHLVGTRNSSTGVMKIYLNGKLSNSTTHITGDIYTGTDNGYIGKEYHSWGYGLNADVYVIRVYNKELSAAGVLQNFNAMKSRFGI